MQIGRSVELGVAEVFIHDTYIAISWQGCLILGIATASVVILAVATAVFIARRAA